MRAFFFLISTFFVLFLGACATTQAPSQAPTQDLSEQSMTLLRLGDRMMEAGDVNAALGFYQNAVETSPENEDIRVMFAQQLLTHRPELASEFLHQSVTQTPSARLYNWLGVSHDIEGRHRQAQESYAQGLRLNPTLALKNNLALSYAVTRNYDSSVRLYDEILEEESSVLLYHKNRAIALILAGEEQRARDDLASIMSPQDITALIDQYRGQADRISSLELLRMINGM